MHNRGGKKSTLINREGKRERLSSSIEDGPHLNRNGEKKEEKEYSERSSPQQKKRREERRSILYLERDALGLFGWEGKKNERR